MQHLAVVAHDELDGVAALDEMVSGEKRILSFMPTLTVRATFFGSPSWPKGVVFDLAGVELPRGRVLIAVSAGRYGVTASAAAATQDVPVLHLGQFRC